ncbi:MAG: TonB-dependent receptor plug domain-containing protein [Bacteroidota bacterium]
MKPFLLLLCALCLSLCPLLGQDSIRISFEVFSQQSEKPVKAIAQLSDGSSKPIKKGAPTHIWWTSQQAFSATVMASGHRPYPLDFIAQGDTLIRLSLQAERQLAVVEITDKVRVHEESQLSLRKLSPQEITSLPALLGEPDVLRAFQFLPGIQGGREGSTGLYVRGGTPDQNLVLFDGLPLYHLSHFGNLTSLFDADLLRQAELYQGGFPAQYAGRLSAVLALDLKQGSKKTSRGVHHVGLLTSKFLREGPIRKSTSSYIFSVRTSPLGPLSLGASTLLFSGQESFGFGFYDLSGKLHFELNRNNWISASFYRGEDGFLYRQKSSPPNQDSLQNLFQGSLRWGNTALGVQWKHLYPNQKTSHQLSVGGSRFTHLTRGKNQLTRTQSPAPPAEDRFQLRFGIQDMVGRIAFQSQQGDHVFQWGGEAIHHQLTPGLTRLHLIQPGEAAQIREEGRRWQAWEMGLYAQGTWQLGAAWKLRTGLHGAHFLFEGSAFPSLQPRISLHHQAGANWAWKLSLSRMVQHLHLLPPRTPGLGSQLWLPASRDLPPARSWQGEIGLAWWLPGPGLEWDATFYLRDNQGLVAFEEGSGSLQLQGDTGVQGLKGGGSGNSFGWEMLVKKSQGKLQGWFSYTLAYHQRQFPFLNEGKPFPFVYERRHDIALVASFPVRPHQRLHFNMVFSSGMPTTTVQSTYSLPGTGNFSPQIESYSPRNSQRLPAYHRLDISLRQKEMHKKGEITWTLGLYNAYNQQNAWFYLNRYDTNEKRSKLYQVSLLPILPAISYRYAW